MNKKKEQIHAEIIIELHFKFEIATRDLTSIANCEGGKWAALAKETLKEIGAENKSIDDLMEKRVYQVIRNQRRPRF